LTALISTYHNWFLNKEGNGSIIFRSFETRSDAENTSAEDFLHYFCLMTTLGHYALTGVDLSQILGELNSLLEGQGVAITDEIIGASQLLGARATVLGLPL